MLPDQRAKRPAAAASPLTSCTSIHSDISSIDELPATMPSPAPSPPSLDDATSQLSDDSSLYSALFPSATATSDPLLDPDASSAASDVVSTSAPAHGPRTPPRPVASPTSAHPDHPTTDGLFARHPSPSPPAPPSTDTLSSLRAAFAEQTAHLKSHAHAHARHLSDQPATPSLVSAAFHMKKPCKEERQRVLAKLGPHLFSCHSSTSVQFPSASPDDDADDAPKPADGPNDHITIWNRLERRKIAGNAAPLRRNVQAYLDKHKDCEVYTGQDLKPGQKPRKAIKKRERLKPALDVWNSLQGRFETPLAHLRDSGVDLSGLKVACVQHAACVSCRVWYSHDEYCAPCHTLTRRVVTVCRSYACRMKRVGVNGSLHPSLQGGFGFEETYRRDDFHFSNSDTDYDIDSSNSDGDLLTKFEDEHVTNLPSISQDFDMCDGVF